VIVNAQECQHRDEHCKSSVSIAIMSWHMHKNIVMRAVNQYNEFAWTQENFDAGGCWETSNLIVVALIAERHGPARKWGQVYKIEKTFPK